jgi:chaperonin GroES
VSIGDVVVFRRYGGTEFSLNGEEYLIVEADDVLGIVEE